MTAAIPAPYDGPDRNEQLRAGVLRAIHGLCPLCDRTEHHVHGTGQMTEGRGRGDWTHLDETEVRAERQRRAERRKLRRVSTS